MLDISKLAPIDPTLNDSDWFKLRHGKFSASEIGKLMSAKSHEGKFSAGALSYIQGKAGERVTALPAKAPFHNQNTDHGEATESEAIQYFCKRYNKAVFRDAERGDTRLLIIEDEYSCATPDSLVAMSSEVNIFNEDKTRLKVAPLEIKCPPILHRFIKLVSCKTPADLKKTEPLYYYQVLTQMIFCESVIGYFACYHKGFPNPMQVIEFNQLDLVDDVRKVKLTLHHAKEKLKDLVLVLQ